MIYTFTYYNFLMRLTEKSTMPSFNKSNLKAPEQLREHAGEACALLKVLANEDRLMLLCQIASARHNVGELEAITGIRQPTLSQQLAVLRSAGLVQTRKAAKLVFYRLDETALGAISGAIGQFGETAPPPQIRAPSSGAANFARLG